MHKLTALFLSVLETFLPGLWCLSLRREGGPTGLGSIPGQQGHWTHPGPQEREAIFVVGAEWLASRQERVLLGVVDVSCCCCLYHCVQKTLENTFVQCQGPKPEMSVLFVCLHPHPRPPVWPSEGQQQTRVWLEQSWWKDLSPRAFLASSRWFQRIQFKDRAFLAERASLPFVGLCLLLRFVSPPAPTRQPGNRCPSWSRA